MSAHIEKLKALAKAATQGDWQVIETELPCRLGRPHVERRIFTTKDHPQLKAPYPVVNGSVALGTDETPVHHMVSMTAEDAAYIAAASANAVLLLIADIERLQKSRIPAGLYRELVALRELRDQTKKYVDSYLLDEVESAETCVSEDQHRCAAELSECLMDAFEAHWDSAMSSAAQNTPEAKA